MTTIGRRPDWPERMLAEIEAAATRPFSWGGHDCTLFAADVVRAMTDHDYAAAARGRYKSRRGALRLLKPYGGLEGLVDSLGLVERPLAFAQRGDVVLADATTDPAEGPSLGIYDGAVALFAAPVGLARLPLHACRRAWRI